MTMKKGKPGEPHQPGQVDKVHDPKRNQDIPVVPQKKESPDEATKRVQEKHT